MIVDSSAVIAILKGEPDANELAMAVLRADRPRMSVANWVEAAIVADNLGDELQNARFDALIAELGVGLVDVDAGQAALARNAHQRYGKSRSDARLNYGDCLAYALAKSTGEPLLFKGNDFSRTDIVPALA